jgi:hypothetical protein
MQTRSLTFRRQLLTSLAVLAVVGVPTAAAANYYPLLEVTGDNHQVGQVNNLIFNLEYMSSAGETERLSIQTPAGFNESLAQAAGTKLGSAGIGLLPTGTNISTSPSAKTTTYSGFLTVMDPAAYAEDPTAQACDPGTHSAIWGLSLVNVAKGDLTIPIAVDASGGGYKLTMCFDALQSVGEEVEFLYLEPGQVFRNPGKRGIYLFDGVVTPFAAATPVSTTTPPAEPDTSAPPTQAPPYELRAYEALPQQLTATARYDTATKALVISGNLEADGRARENVEVQVFGASTPDAVKWANLGLTTTGNGGSYSLNKRLNSLRYPYVYSYAPDSNSAICSSRSAEPAGCASTSTDGRASSAVKVAVRS